MIALIDNYDSFTFNLVQYLGDLRVESNVYRNDKISVAGVLDLKPQGIVISPGPGIPDESGICLDLVKAAAENSIPLLGVCLGHQAIGQAFGGRVIQTSPMHGKTSYITHKASGVFAGLDSPLEVARYHSLCVERSTLPDVLKITAESEDGVIMGLQHKSLPIHGVQFHPESIATQSGHDILSAFVDLMNEKS